MLPVRISQFTECLPKLCKLRSWRHLSTRVFLRRLASIKSLPVCAGATVP
jgi:hypothetical protein